MMVKLFFSVFFSVLTMTLSFSVFAQEQNASSAAEGETKIKIEEAAGKKNTVDGDIDQEITNRMLRAETGSKSKWSISLTGNYQGASLEKPFDKDRPNLTNDAYAPRVRMGGDIGVRYRMSKNASVSAGTGWSIERPFHEAKRGDVSTPYVGINNATKAWGLQHVSSAMASLATDSDDLDLSMLGVFSLGHTMIYDFDGSASSVGLSLDGWVAAFNSDDVAADSQRDYGFGAYPFFEYVFNDTFNFRTVFRPWMYSHTRAQRAGEYMHIPWTQSVGLGIAITRDIFLYPNFQFAWETWREDDFNLFRKNTREGATVALSATVNVF